MGATISAILKAKSPYLVLQSVDCRKAGRTSGGGRPTNRAYVSVPCKVTCQTGKCYGKAESQHSYGMGTKDEQHP